MGKPLQYVVPQQVLIEDRIIGPVTLKQLVIVAIGGGIAYMIYISLAATYFAVVWAPPVAIISLITLAIAFVQIKSIRFVPWVLLMIEYAFMPVKRVWNKRESTEKLFYTLGRPKVEKKKGEGEAPVITPQEQKIEALKKQRGLTELTQMLDQHNPVQDEVSHQAVSHAPDHHLASHSVAKEKAENEKLSEASQT